MNYSFIIIPEEIKKDNKLSPITKIIFGEILSLSRSKGLCWATDEHFQNTFGISQGTVQRSMKQLEQAKLIKRITNYKAKDGNVKKDRTIVVTNNDYIDVSSIPVL